MLLIRRRFNMHQFVFYLAVILSASSAAAEDCLPGTIKVEKEGGGGFVCEPCPEGTYSDQSNLTKCELCSHLHVCDPSCVENNTYCVEPYLLCVTPCQPDHDTVVECSQPDFFYQNDHKTCRLCTRCEESDQLTAENCTGETDTKCCPLGTYYDRNGVGVCTECKHCEDLGQITALNCSAAHDAVCCAEEYMIAKDGECVAYCAVKEYLVPHTENSSNSHDVCVTCAVNTTNYETSHRKQTCEETCFETKDQDIRYETICLEDEYKLGNSCWSEGLVVCALSGDAKNTDTDCTKKLDVWVIVVIVIICLVFAAVLFFFLCRWIAAWWRQSKYNVS